MEGAGPINGVFFLAVYRGKVSEGLDFADDNARTVIAVSLNVFLFFHIIVFFISETQEATIHVSVYCML